jgi:UDP-N-acetylmuramoyl-tripeptide--D-alanyl-D-alanine ligase
MRMTPQVVGGITFFNDAYNANPDSMVAALDTFIELTEGARRRLVVLGDMLELGTESGQLHRQVARHLIEMDRACRIDHAIFIGEHMSEAHDEIEPAWGVRAMHVDGLDKKARAAVRKIIRAGDAVLVKASRGMGLERVIDAFETPAKKQKATMRKPEKPKAETVAS